MGKREAGAGFFIQQGGGGVCASVRSAFIIAVNMHLAACRGMGPTGRYGLYCTHMSSPKESSIVWMLYRVSDDGLMISFHRVQPAAMPTRMLGFHCDNSQRRGL